MKDILLFILLYICSVSGQMVFWPKVLTAPVDEEPGDSNIIEINSEQNLRINIYELNNSISILRNDSLKEFKQVCRYELSDDNSLNLQNHYLDISGAFSRKNFPFRFTSLGLEWIPTAVFNRSPETKKALGNDTSFVYNSNGIGSIRLGPSIGIEYMNLPIRLSGGGAVDLWHSELPYKPGWHHLVKAKGDPGFYGALTVGNNRRRMIESIPFYGQGSIFGRYMKSVGNEKITNGEINTLFFRDVAFADTFFLYCADTLSKGRTAFLSEQAHGSARYISTPNRTNNSLQATCGINNIGTLFLKPSLAYTWTLSSVTYPPSKEAYYDERFITHTIALMAQNDSSRFLNYEGGISFSFENDDWLFKDKLPDTLFPGDALLEDSLDKNLQDFEGFHTQMYHRVNKKFKNNFEFNYLFDIERYKVTYPSFYIKSNNDITHSEDDRDKVSYKHTLDLTLFSFPRIKMTALVDYFKNEFVNLRKEKSSYNKTERIYRLETSCIINPEGSTSLKETIGAFARNDEYHFPEFQTDGPPMSREFYSKFRGTWKINEPLLLEGYWNEIYSDDGYWHDPKIHTSNHFSRKGEYYAIEGKSLETSVELITSYKFPNNFIMRIGSLFKYIYYEDFDFNINDYSNLEISYLMPFIEINAQLFGHLFVRGRIERYIDPDADDYWKAFSTMYMVF